MKEEKTIVAVANILPEPKLPDRWILYSMKNFQGNTDDLEKRIDKLNKAVTPKPTFYCVTEYENLEWKVGYVLGQPKEMWKIIDVDELDGYGVKVNIETEEKE
tara:strand:+ start:235 stop:543 length:309 start_codon:yes stop_codon:yes gene_type:complete